MSDSGRVTILGRATKRGCTFDLSGLPEDAVLLSAELTEPDGTLTVLYRIPEEADEFADVEECCLGCPDLEADVDDGGLFHYCPKSQGCDKFLAYVEAERAAMGDE